MSLPTTTDLHNALRAAKAARTTIELTRARGEEHSYTATLDAINRTIEVLTERLYTRQRRAALADFGVTP